jgi:hypothetical protein
MILYQSATGEFWKQLGIGGAGLGALYLVLRYKPWRNGNGGITEDRVKLLISEAVEETRHKLRNEMQAAIAKIELRIRDRR